MLMKRNKLGDSFKGAPGSENALFNNKKIADCKCFHKLLQKTLAHT